MDTLLMINTEHILKSDFISKKEKKAVLFILYR